MWENHCTTKAGVHRICYPKTTARSTRGAIWVVKTCTEQAVTTRGNPEARLSVLAEPSSHFPSNGFGKFMKVSLFDFWNLHTKHPRVSRVISLQIALHFPSLE